MGAGATPPIGETVTPGTGATGPAAHIRLARLADVRDLVGLYLGQSDDSRSLYHPFPFDAGKLRLIYSYMILERPLAPLMARLAPGWSAVLLVATAPEDGRVIGYGTVRFEPDSRSDLRAKFGYLVAGSHQRRGIGTLIMAEMMRIGISLGARHLGGTVLRENVACQRVLAKYGFRVGGTAGPDLYAPGRTNLVVDLTVRGERAAGEPGLAGPTVESVPEPTGAG